MYIPRRWRTRSSSTPSRTLLVQDSETWALRRSLTLFVCLYSFNVLFGREAWVPRFMGMLGGKLISRQSNSF